MNSLCKDYNVEITTSWILECEDKDLQCILTFDCSMSKSVDLDDVVQLDTCIHLLQNAKKENNKEPCTITIASENSTDMISRIVLVSEARIIELYGSCGEYISTVTAEFIDDFEGCSVYMAECSIRPVKQVTLKFQRTKHDDSLWLYGINLRLCQEKGLLTNLSSINYQSVNDILKETKMPLSENAEKCKSFLQTYCSGRASATNSQMLMKMMEAEYLNSLGETGKTMSNCISSFMPFLSKDKLETSASESTPVNSLNQSTMDVLDLKAYIDKQFNALEKRIVKFEQKLADIEVKHSAKLDHIIALLNKNCST